MGKIKAGVIGDPISHSLSPKIHQFWIHQYAIDASYEAVQIKPAKLLDSLKKMADKGFRGLNVTVPHKEAVFALCDETTETAQSIGAVNVLTFNNGKFVGGNSDAYGFWINLAESLKSRGRPLPRRSAKILVLGAGGAARAVMHALKMQGYSNVLVSNRTQERASALVKDFSLGDVAPWESRFPIIKQVDMVINTTSLGMAGQPFLFVANAIPNLKSYQIAYDLVYRPLETQLTRGTLAKKAVAVNGLGMLLHQAVPSFHEFFGVEPEVSDKLRALILDLL